MKRVLLDTNFLMIPAAFRVDIFAELERIMHEPYEVCILDRTVDELRKITETQRGKDKDAARLALELARHKRVKIIITKENKVVDDLIAQIANSKSFIVATQDRELKNKLKAKRVPLIVMRQKKYLKLNG
jgi:hypothetical protein